MRAIAAALALVLLVPGGVGAQSSSTEVASDVSETSDGGSKDCALKAPARYHGADYYLVQGPAGPLGSYRYYDGACWSGPVISYEMGVLSGIFASGGLGSEGLETLGLMLGGGGNGMWLAIFVLVIVSRYIALVAQRVATLLLLLGVPAEPGEVATERAAAAAPEPPAPQGEAVHPAAGPPGSGVQCDASSYRGTPSVKAKDRGSPKTPAVSTATPALARAEFWVHEDCSVRMELIWQAKHKGLCYILVASGTGTSTERGVSPQEITEAFDGGTTLIDWACPRSIAGAGSSGCSIATSTSTRRRDARRDS